MRVVAKMSGLLLGLLTVCTALGGCAPAHTGPVDGERFSVLIRDTSRADRDTQTLIAGAHLLVVVTARETGGHPGARRMYALETPDAALQAALEECRTLAGDPGQTLGPLDMTAAPIAPIQRALCPNASATQRRETAETVTFPPAHPIAAVLQTVYEAVNSPGYEVTSAPTWAFRSHLVMQALNLDATP